MFLLTLCICKYVDILVDHLDLLFLEFSFLILVGVLPLSPLISAWEREFGHSWEYFLLGITISAKPVFVLVLHLCCLCIFGMLNSKQAPKM